MVSLAVSAIVHAPGYLTDELVGDSLVSPQEDWGYRCKPPHLALLWVWELNSSSLDFMVSLFTCWAIWPASPCFSFLKLGLLLSQALADITRLADHQALGVLLSPLPRAG